LTSPRFALTFVAVSALSVSAAMAAPSPLPSPASAGPSATPAPLATSSAPQEVPPPAVPAPPPPESLPGGAPAGMTATHIGGFDHIRTDKFDYNLNTGDFTLPGPFTADSTDGTDVSADKATGNSKSKVMHAEGHVVVHQTRPIQNHGSTTTVTQRPSTLTCDKLDVDGSHKLYIATGHMHFTQEGGRSASADRAILDDANHHLHMEGNVHVRNGEQTVAADVLDYDTSSGELDGNGDVTISTPIETPAPGSVSPSHPRRHRLPI